LKASKIIVALDVDDIKEVKKWVELLSPYIEIFKIGPRLFIPYGKRVINLIKEYGCGVFLDLKLHDIPTQVAKSVEKIAKLGVKMFTIHALGGREMIKESRKVLDDISPEKRPLMLAVTILTSLDKNSLHFLNFKNKINILVFKLAKLAIEEGCDGVVCSVKELGYLKKKIKKNFIAVVPGIRLGDKREDQKRTGTPEEAFRKGADYIVMGRSILNAPDPIKVLKEIKKYEGLCPDR
jgi:orotidine-5'-phosphate decarboxylase